MVRATQEGIVFALNYGFEIMKDMKIETKTVRAGNANLFLSPLFRQIFADVTGSELQLVDSNGSLGAAIGGAIGLGKINQSDWKSGLKPMFTVSPDAKRSVWYSNLYAGWKTKVDLN
jgi:xylulokinase